MPELCSSELCTGCWGCFNICPKNAISMRPDKRGFLHPDIDPEKCIECKLCEKTCPPLTGRISANETKPITYAAWHKDTRVRIGSSSGGAFSALAEGILNLEGIVYGAAWENSRKVIHKRITTPDGLEDLRKSKYIPSEIHKTYRNVKEDLNNQKYVLFSGTPCQIAALYAFLKNTDKSRLYTVDFICHGVPSPALFEKYITHIEKAERHKVIGVNFRDKRLGVETNLLIVLTLDNGKEIIKRFDGNSFYRAFVENVALRTACTNCPFNIMPRRADISLADFRGLGTMGHFDYEKERHLGFSGLLVNNPKGLELLHMAKNILLDQREFEELKARQPLLGHPAKAAHRSECFWKDYEQGESYSKLAHTYLKMPMRMRVMNMARILLGPKKYYWLSDTIRHIRHKS